MYSQLSEWHQFGEPSTTNDAAHVRKKQQLSGMKHIHQLN